MFSLEISGFGRHLGANIASGIHNINNTNMDRHDTTTLTTTPKKSPFNGDRYLQGQVVLMILEHCDNIQDALRLASINKSSRENFVQCQRSVIMRVCRDSFMGFDQALVAVRATNMVSQHVRSCGNTTIQQDAAIMNMNLDVLDPRLNGLGGPLLSEYRQMCSLRRVCRFYETKVREMDRYTLGGGPTAEDLEQQQQQQRDQQQSQLSFSAAAADIGERLARAFAAALAPEPTTETMSATTATAEAEAEAIKTTTLTREMRDRHPEVQLFHRSFYRLLIIGAAQFEAMHQPFVVASATFSKYYVDGQWQETKVAAKCADNNNNNNKNNRNNTNDDNTDKVAAAAAAAAATTIKPAPWSFLHRHITGEGHRYWKDETLPRSTTDITEERLSAHYEASLGIYEDARKKQLQRDLDELGGDNDDDDDEDDNNPVTAAARKEITARYHDSFEPSDIDFLLQFPAWNPMANTEAQLEQTYGGLAGWLYHDFAQFDSWSAWHYFPGQQGTIINTCGSNAGDNSQKPESFVRTVDRRVAGGYETVTKSLGFEQVSRLRELEALMVMEMFICDIRRYACDDERDQMAADGDDEDPLRRKGYDWLDPDADWKFVAKARAYYYHNSRDRRETEEGGEEKEEDAEDEEDERYVATTIFPDTFRLERQFFIPGKGSPSTTTETTGQAWRRRILQVGRANRVCRSQYDILRIPVRDMRVDRLLAVGGDMRDLQNWLKTEYYDGVGYSRFLRRHRRARQHRADDGRQDDQDEENQDTGHRDPAPQTKYVLFETILRRHFGLEFRQNAFPKGNKDYEGFGMPSIICSSSKVFSQTSEIEQHWRRLRHEAQGGDYKDEYEDEGFTSTLIGRVVDFDAVWRTATAVPAIPEMDYVVTRMF